MWPYDDADAEWLTARRPVASAPVVSTPAAPAAAPVAAAAAPARRRRPGVAARLLAAVASWRAQAVARDQLHAMTDRELSDIGISRADIEFVLRRPAKDLRPANVNLSGGVLTGALHGLTRGATGWWEAA